MLGKGSVPSWPSVWFIINSMARFHHNTFQSLSHILFKKSSYSQKLYTTFHCKEKQLIWGNKCSFSHSQHYCLENYFLLPIILFLSLRYIVEERLSYYKDHSLRNKIQINISFSHLLEENLVSSYNEIV